MTRLLLLTLVCAPMTLAAQPATFAIDPAASTLAYTGSHPAHDWTGTSRQVTGSVRLDPAQPAGARVEISAPVESFDSGNGSRDSNMLDLVAVEDYPDVRFVSEQVVVQTWKAVEGGFAGTWQVRGTLSFHGEAHPAEIPVTVRVANGRLEATAAFPVSLSQFGVKRPKLLFVPIRDEIAMQADLVATAR